MVAGGLSLTRAMCMKMHDLVSKSCLSNALLNRAEGTDRVWGQGGDLDPLDFGR